MGRQYYISHYWTEIVDLKALYIFCWTSIMHCIFAIQIFSVSHCVISVSQMWCIILVWNYLGALSDLTVVTYILDWSWFGVRHFQVLINRLLLNKKINLSAMHFLYIGLNRSFLYQIPKTWKMHSLSLAIDWKYYGRAFLKCISRKIFTVKFWELLRIIICCWNYFNMKMNLYHICVRPHPG